MLACKFASTQSHKWRIHSFVDIKFLENLFSNIGKGNLYVNNIENLPKLSNIVGEGGVF